MVDEGVPNVISMKFLLRMTTMSTFCDELFAALVRNESIDDALLSAIATVADGPSFTDKNPGSSVEYYSVAAKNEAGLSHPTRTVAGAAAPG